MGYLPILTVRSLGSCGSLILSGTYCIHVRRLQKLDDLAATVLDTSANSMATLEELDNEISDFETSCTSLSPDEVENRARLIREKLEVSRKI